MTHSFYMLHFHMPEWIQQYSEFFIQPDKLQEIVDSFMEDYDKRKEEVRVLQPVLLLLLHLPIWSVWLQLWQFVFLCHRTRRGRRRRLSSNKRMRKAGWKWQEDTKAPRPVPTVRQPTGGLYRKRSGRRRGRSSWTSTPGSTETRRKNVSCQFSLVFSSSAG